MYSTDLARMIPLLGFAAAAAAAALPAPAPCAICAAIPIPIIVGVRGLVPNAGSGSKPGVGESMAESGVPGEPGVSSLPLVTCSRRHSGRSEASSVMRSLMLSRRRRSTALCDSRRLRRFSVSRAALQAHGTRDRVSFPVP